MFEILSVERLMGGVGIAVPAGQKLTVMLGDTVRVHLGVDYRGPVIDGSIHVSYGQQNAWFNQDGNKQEDIPAHFDASMDWVPYEFACDIYIGGSPGTNYDLYAKIMGVPGPDIFSSTLMNVLDVLGAPEFQGFEITGYEKV
ncbi:hypothetical protein ES705_39932 [subsurface metagenome]